MGARPLTDRKSTPLPIDRGDKLGLQVGTGLVAAVMRPGLQKIRELRSRLALDGMSLPLVQVRDNAALASFNFLMHDDGRRAAEGDFATIGDILQTLSRTEVATPPLCTFVRPVIAGHYVVIN